MITAVLILLTSFIAGYILAYLTRDEIWYIRKWLVLLVVVSLLACLIISFIRFNFGTKLSVLLSLFYISIVSLICVYKSYDKKFIKKDV